MSRETPSFDPVEILAQYKAGNIDRGQLSENDNQVLSYYLGLAIDDPKFARDIKLRQQQILNPTPPQESLVQMELFSNPTPPSEKDTSQSLEKMHREQWRQQQRWSRMKPDPKLREEIKIKKKELRQTIGLPVARGKSPYVNDSLYKYLVKRIYTYDNFGIFNDYFSPFPVENLDTRISQVATLVDNMLNSPDLDTKRKKWNYFKQFSFEYKQRWSKS